MRHGSASPPKKKVGTATEAGKKEEKKVVVVAWKRTEHGVEVDGASRIDLVFDVGHRCLLRVRIGPPTKVWMGMGSLRALLVSGV